MILILAFAFFSRIWRLHIPSNYIFDEVYHASTAKLIANNDERAFEWDSKAPEENTAIDWLHPPLAKYTQAFFIKTFGETSFAWRLSSTLFAVGLIYLIYLLAEELFADFKISLLAAFLASLDGLLLVQSRIAMNDVHVSFFIILTLLLYLRNRRIKNPESRIKNLFWVGLTAGLAMASKWSGVFALGIIWLFSAIGQPAFGWGNYNLLKNNFKNFIKIFLVLAILPIAIYILSYSQMFLQGKSLFCFEQKAIKNICYYGQIKFRDKIIWNGYWSHFAELHRQIFHYQTHLDATHSYQSRPWQWFLNMKPVWVWVDYGDGARADIYAQGNTILFWSGAIAVAISLALVILNLFQDLFKIKIKILDQGFGELSRVVRDDTWGIFLILLSYFLVWLPWQLSPRIMFFYHYLPAVPLLCILLAYWLTKLNKYFIYFVLFLIILNFVLFYPHWTGISMPNEWKDSLYFFFESWK
ncbi:MAG: phospholipid carrier-dependent glycosyltransferase [Patescibacteria group bacterium]